MNKTILIKNGRVHTGDKFVPETDILVKDGIIVSVGHVSHNYADEIIDAQGMIVCPGFIDVHNMNDTITTLDGNNAENLILQGVTSCIIGNCGRSGVFSSSSSFVSMLDQLRSMRLGVNVGLMIGHNSLRRFVLPEPERQATPREIEMMVEIVEEAMRHGALGMSSGLMYSPGVFATDTELTALVSAVGKYGGTYATHMRDEGDQIVAATMEALETALRGDARLVICHFKAAGKENWRKAEQCVEIIEGRRGAQEIYVDFYPYTATSTVLSIILPPTIHQRVGGNLRQLSWSYEDEKLVEEHGKQNLCANGWDDVVIVSSRIADVVGKSISVLSKSSGISCYQVVVDIIRRDPSARAVFYNIASEHTLYRISSLPYAMPATDGYVYPSGSRDATHPRNYGAFSKVLREYVMENRIFSLEEFIRKSTKVPAMAFNIKNRGLLKSGYFADIIIFDPEKVRDLATYKHPWIPSTGVMHVLINGVLVYSGGRFLDNFPGMLLT